MRTFLRSEQANEVLEFTLVGIPLICILISIMGICITMWNYHTLAYAVREGARYAATKGRGCASEGNSCGLTVAAVANRIAAAGSGLVPNQLNVTLRSTAGDILCNPLSSCYNSLGSWPPSTANQPGTDIYIFGYYSPPTPLIFMIWPGTTAIQFGSIVLPASTRQRILF
jgi:hypothetical protein